MKIPFFIETFINKIVKTQIVTIVECYIDDKKTRKFYGKSLTANFLQAIYNHFANNDGDFATGTFCNSLIAVGKNTSNSQINSANPDMNLNANTSVSTNGIVVGSGNTAPVPADYKLGTQIATGSGAGQLNYQNQVGLAGPTIVGQTTSFILQRLFTNNSGGNVNVNEIGLQFLLSGQSYLIYRDVLGSTDVIPDGSTYRVSITFQITT